MHYILHACIVVWSLFNKKPRKFTKRSQKRKKKHGTWTYLELKLRNLVSDCNKPGLVHDIKTLVFSSLQRKLGILIDLANILLLEQKVPKHIPLIIKDLASFRLGLHKTEKVTKIDSTTKTFLKVPFHNKGMEMINLS